jgi:membrane associated rhomboid family serine protease
MALLCVNVALTVVPLMAVWTAHWRLTTLLNAVGIVPGHLRPYTLLTYMFFHESLGHLLLNMCYLWVFGAGVEAALGARKFLGIYLLSGVVGGALQWIVTVQLAPDAEAVPIVGASAACAGMIGLYAVRYYRARLAFVGLWFQPHVVTVISAFLAYEIVGGLWSVWQGSAEAGVAHWAHIGGFVFGLTCAQILKLDAAGQIAYLAQDATRAMAASVPGAAIRRWETLLNREPDNTDARRELARAWLLLGDEEQATVQYSRAIQTLLGAARRGEATDFYTEMRQHRLSDSTLTVSQLYVLGNVLEEREQGALAAEALRRVADLSPQSPEGETAMLKVISLYVHQLDRRAEARELLALFRLRHPQTSWRGLADDLERAAG